MRRGQEGQGPVPRMPLLALPLQHLGGPRRAQLRYPTAERRDLPGDRRPQGSLAFRTRSVCVYYSGDLGQLHTVMSGFSLVTVSCGSRLKRGRG